MNIKYSPLLPSVCLVALTLCFGCATAQRGAVSRAQSALDNGKYQVALNRLSQGESYTTPTRSIGAQMCYMKGLCYEGMHKPEEAKAMFRYVADHYNETEYAYMAQEKLSKHEKP